MKTVYLKQMGGCYRAKKALLGNWSFWFCRGSRLQPQLQPQVSSRSAAPAQNAACTTCWDDKAKKRLVAVILKAVVAALTLLPSRTVSAGHQAEGSGGLQI